LTRASGSGWLINGRSENGDNKKGLDIEDQKP
jgi:hypothetical protein